MTKDSLLAEEPFLSIIGGTQPGVVKETFGGNFLVESGFNHRWMFVYPDEKPPVMYSESSVSKMFLTLGQNLLTDYWTLISAVTVQTHS